MACYSDMPEEVVFQILLLLPVVSLLRFKSVCKSWYSLIESSCFIAQHLQHQQQGNDKIIYFSPCTYICRRPTSINFTLFCADNFQASEILDVPLQLEEMFGKMIASCNGLICMTFGTSDLNNVVLCNVVTKHIRILPKSPVPLPRTHQIYLGFGFDVKTNDYKVVRVIHEESWPNSRAEVYNLSTDTWRNIGGVSINWIFSDPKAPYREGTYCWMGQQSQYDELPSTRYWLILAFDFGTEVFHTISLPDVYSVWDYSDSRYSLELAILRDDIACIYSVNGSPETKDWLFKIWVLVEYGVKESWTNLYTIEIKHHSWNYPLGFSKNGKLIVLQDDRQCMCDPTYCLCGNKSKIGLCDLVTQEVKTFSDHVDFSMPRNLQAVAYQESLTSINKANGAANWMPCVVSEPELVAANSTRKSVAKGMKKEKNSAGVAAQEVRYPLLENGGQQSCKGGSSFLIKTP